MSLKFQRHYQYGILCLYSMNKGIRVLITRHIPGLVWEGGKVERPKSHV
jgi:hypothetical protein